MAPNKDKLLESAQKNLKKKQIARAIKDYVKVVELDPADVRSRQKLAELFVRTNKNSEAYEQYEAVAKYFSSNGFYLKAIAIYKQMQRLDPSQVSLYNRLAELNEKQGLIGNAMAEYRNLATYYERNGMVADGIKTLEKMRDLDPANLNVRVKLAEVYAANEREDEGLVEFEGVLTTLRERREYDKVLKLYKMFLPLFPRNRKLQTGLALTLYDKGELAKGLTILNNLLKDSPEDPDLLRLMARGYNDQEDWENARQTYQLLLKLDPTDLDIRESLILSYLQSGHPEEALAELEEWKDAFFKSDRLEFLKSHYESLKGLLPDNPLVVDTLDSIYELTGDGEKLLDIMSQKEEPEKQPEVEETLSDSLLGTVVEDIEEVPTIDLELSDPSEESVAIPVEEESEGLVFELPTEESDIELQLEPLDEPVAEEPEDEIIELNLSDTDELEPVAEEGLEFSFELSEDQAAEAAAADQRDIQADLQEAEFYIQQGLYAEAEKLCRDILAYAPDSVECQQKLEEIKPHLTEQQEASTGLEDLAAEVFGDDFPELDAGPANVSEEKKVFRTDVDEQIAADDLESHYNLGIAYREMGLLDDAISEFTKAEPDPTRYVDCLTLKGLCYADKVDYGNAEQMFRLALDSEHLEEVQRLNLGYELGSLYERSERFAEALVSFQAVLDQDSDYRDVAGKVSALKSQLGEAGDLPVEPLEENKERISFL